MTITSTTTRTTIPALALEPDYAHYSSVSWEKFAAIIESFLREGGRPDLRVTYHQGEMEIMTKGPKHERAKSTIGRLIETYALEANIDITPLGETTWVRADLKVGLEADECYYVRTPVPPTGNDANALIDLKRYPPPDLAIEVEMSRGSIPKLPIYAAMGVPEVWRFDDPRIVVLHRSAGGDYEVRDRSLAFPELDLNPFNHFLDMALNASHPQAVKALRDWVRSSRS